VCVWNEPTFKLIDRMHEWRQECALEKRLMLDSPSDTESVRLNYCESSRNQRRNEKPQDERDLGELPTMNHEIKCTKLSLERPSENRH